MDKIKQAWQIRNAAHSDIQFADNKAGAITGLATLGVALLSDISPNLPAWKFALVIIAGLLLAGAIVASVLSVRLRPISSSKGTIFFDHVAADQAFTTYKQALEQSDPFEEVAKQAYEISRITKKKFALVTYANSFLFSGLIFLWISLLLTGMSS